MYSSKSVKNYIYAEIQAEIFMFTQQIRRGLNRQILRPLWLMTSAAVDVISVPGVLQHKSSQCHSYNTFVKRNVILKGMVWVLRPCQFIHKHGQ